MALNKETIVDMALAAKGTIIVSIPESLGMFGEIMVMPYLDIAKKRLSKARKPVRFTQSHDDAEIAEIVFADTSRLHKDEKYLNCFVRMAHQCHAVEVHTFF